MATTYAIPDGRVAMAATLYTGNGSSLAVNNAVNGVSMQPDFVWVKSRSLGTTNESYHFLADVVQGLYSGSVYNYLNSNTTASQNNSGSNVPTSYGGVLSLNSNGFSVTAAGSGTYTNQSAATYVGWQWKAGGTAVSNTAGSITSQVSANTTAGFSVVTWTGTNTNSTIGHGLGVAPAMYITKQRSATGDWFVYHQSVGATKGLFLNLTNAAATNTYFNNTSPTSTVFSIGGGVGGLNASGVTQVTYCFAPVAGYSAFGSYTGNASANGPFVYLGFRPRFLMVKSSTQATDWMIVDTATSSYNATPNFLRPNISNAEVTGRLDFDILSNGFKVRDTGSVNNTSGQTYIYIAFAEVPFAFANAR